MDRTVMLTSSLAMALSEKAVPLKAAGRRRARIM
jgi:hypothetical protein